MNINIQELGALFVVAGFYSVIYFLKKKRNVEFGSLTILAVGFGVVVGLIFKGTFEYYSVFGTIYTQMISAIVVPLLLFSIISSITNLGNEVRLKQIGWKTIIFLLLNTFLASVITLIVSIVTNVGNGFSYELATNYEAREVPSMMETITSLFPSNLAKHWAEGQVIPIVIFAIIVAIAYNALIKEKVDKISIFKEIIDAGNRVMGKVVSFVIELTPYAVISLIGRSVSKNALDDLLPLLGVLILVYALSVVQIFVVEGTIIGLIGKLNPIQFFKGIFPAGIVAFTSQSSIGTIPVTKKQLTEKLGVEEDVATFTTTLGANLGMPGCAGIWPTLLAVFSIHILDITYTIPQYLFLVVLSVVVAIGTVGVPGTATITATAVFMAAGLPVEVIILLSPISSLADMARTATNVIGAAEAAVVVAKLEHRLNLAVYNGEELEKKEIKLVITE
ncbi:dicarboxylate/amino acid:cation symporter [Lachnospiraceae bacterium LCP25S3_G4]